MNLALVIVIAAVLALCVILRLAVTQTLLVKRTAAFHGAIRPIDVEAFRNLINPAEDEYLRNRLTAAQFRLVRRERLRAMGAYVRVIGHNAAALVRIGEAALEGGEAQLTEPAHQLVNDALLLRRNATIALIRIYVALALPDSGLAAVRVVDRYERLTGVAMLLGRLQNPGVAVRLSAR